MWPFARKTKDDEPTSPPSGPRAPRSEQADQEIVQEVLMWLGHHLPGGGARQVEDEPVIHVGHPPQHVVFPEGNAPAGAVLRVKRGKLSWVDLYDPALRQPLNELIQYLDRQQKWSFNGVVSTRYDESGPPQQR